MPNGNKKVAGQARAGGVSVGVQHGQSLQVKSSVGGADVSVHTPGKNSNADVHVMVPKNTSVSITEQGDRDQAGVVQRYWHGPVGTLVRAYLAAVLTLAVTEWTNAASVSFSNLKTWVLAGLASILPVVIRAIDPKDTAYGLGKK